MENRHSEQFTSTLFTVTSMELFPGLHGKECEHCTGNFTNFCIPLNVTLSTFRYKKQNLIGLMITCHHQNAAQYHSLKKYVSIERSPILKKNEIK